MKFKSNETPAVTFFIFMKALVSHLINLHSHGITKLIGGAPL